MGKIVKHCTACEESFAQKFGFCPNCGGVLKAFEMNPVQEDAKIAAESTNDTVNVVETPKPGIADDRNFTTTAKSSNENHETSPKIVPAVAPAISAFSTNGISANGKSSNGSGNGVSSNNTPANEVQPRPTRIVAAPETFAKTPAPEVSKPETVKAEAPKIEPPIAKTPIAAKPIVDAKPIAATVAAAAGADANGYARQNSVNTAPAYKFGNVPADKGFNVTVIEEKNVGRRNLLLLGSMFFMLTLVISGVVYSLFSKDLLLGAIDAGNPLYITPVDNVPMPIEEQLKPKVEKKAGGGGGGGNENPDPVTKGVPPTQVANPVAPLMMAPKMTNPDIKIVNQTQGTIVRPPTNEQVGLPSGLTSDRLSSGGGSGGGFGNGRGSGAGNGLGTGEGNGNGSGSGNGNGNGNGNGKGNGNEGRGAAAPPPPPVAAGPTTGIVITAKPRPPYTDAARQNQTTGTVTLRVTFLSNGQIGSIATVNGLPYGLTESAIAAARQIRFEPAKKSGVPQTVTKQVQFSFTLY